MDVEKILHYALQREHEGKRFFEEHAGRMSHAAAAGVFHRLAEEEQKHIEFIEHQLDALRGTRDADPGATAELRADDYFKSRAEAEMLDQTVIESMVPDLAILRMAYLIERDFGEFYEMAASKSTGAVQDALQTLAEWERGHERLFLGLHDKVFQEYAEMPWGG
jgi:rubrerythrin